MTFLGFIVAVLIIGGIFYAWYAYAGRTRQNDDAQGRNATAQGAGRMRTSTAMETGTIGELPEGKQDKYVEGNAVNSGNIPRNVLNPDHGYNVETGTIGDVEQPVGAKGLAEGDTTNATKTGGAEDLTSAIHQAFREEFYQIDDKDKTH